MTKTKLNSFCLLNGKLQKEKDAKISVNDIGLHRSYGVFEVLRTYNGKAFLLKEHLDRLYNSAKEINLKIPYNKTQISEYINTLLAKNSHKESLIKILITGGESDDGMTPKNKPTFLILTKNLHGSKKKIYEKGVKLITYEHERFIPTAKTLHYVQLLKSLKRLKNEKAFTLLYTSNGHILEGATCNIFFFNGRNLITPKTDVLNGITRDLVTKLASKYFVIQHKEVKLETIRSCKEAFLTLTTKGIVPVVKINKQMIGKGIPGSNTKLVMELFNEYVENFKKT